MKTLLILTLVATSEMYMPGSTYTPSSTSYNRSVSVTSQVLDNTDYFGCLEIGKKYEKYASVSMQRTFECYELGKKHP